MTIRGAGMLPFMTPTSMIGRVSTCPLMPEAGLVAAQVGSARQSRSGASPIAPLYPNPDRGFAPLLLAPSAVAGSPGLNVPPSGPLNPRRNSVPGKPFLLSLTLHD